MRTGIKIFIIFLICYTGAASAQDTLSIMYYNILNYSPSNTANKNNLKGIVNYIHPDVFAVNEISNDTSAKHILQYVLNIDSSHHYKKAAYTDGPDTDNMLFYNSDKLSLALQDTVQTDLRIIDEYLLYYNNSAYISQHDTAFLDFYIAHLKASQGYEQDRLGEIQKLENHWNEKPGRKNIFIGGDMNFYTATEPGLVKLLDTGAYQMNDPLDSIADWHDSLTYAHLHTQSTRLRQFGGGASGGLDDRFDFIFVSNDVMQGNNQVRYIPGTYKAFGNDGHHLNDSLTALPLDPEIPDSVTYELYNMSDHLPVIMKVYLNFDASLPRVETASNNEPFVVFPNPSTGEFNLLLKNYNDEAEVVIYSLMGQEEQQCRIVPVSNGISSIQIKNLESGVYFANIKINNKYYSKKIVVIR